MQNIKQVREVIRDHLAAHFVDAARSCLAERPPKRRAARKALCSIAKMYDVPAHDVTLDRFSEIDIQRADRKTRSRLAKLGYQGPDPVLDAILDLSRAAR